MSLTLYFNPLSQPSRAVLALVSLGKVEFTPKVIDLMKQENLTPEFTKINPCQSVPAIDDGGFKLFESHAILRYLVTKYKLTDFYPQDPHQVGLIECYLDWHHTGTRKIGGFIMDFVFGPKFMGRPAPEGQEARLKEVEDILLFIEYVFLGQGKYKFIHNQAKPSIADLSCIFELLGLFIFNYDFQKFPGLKQYIQNLLAFPEVKKANEVFFGMLAQNQPDLNEFIKSQIH